MWTGINIQSIAPKNLPKKNENLFTQNACMNVPNSKMVHGAILYLILFPKLSILSQFPLWISALMKITYLVFNGLPVKIKFIVLYKATVR